LIRRTKKAEIKKDEKYKEFIGLIEWASNFYLDKVPYSYIKNREDFVGMGYVVLANCLKKWEGRDNSKEFAKYFKTSLFNAYKNMLAKIYSHKRRAKVEYVETDEMEDSPVKIFRPGKEPIIFRPKRDTPKVDKVFYPADRSIQDPKLPELRATEDGFSNLLYEDLVRHISDQIPNEIEKKIFIFMADPPEDLCVEALAENRRKMKASVRGMVSGVNKVKTSGGIIIKYLKKNGDVISKGQYQTHLKNIRDKVKEVLKEG
jgi:hypothetical protein